MQANFDVTRELQTSATILAQVANDPVLAGRISQAVLICVEPLRRGNKLLFARQIEALGRPGDVLFAYSTSGNSPNIVPALERARQLQVTTIGMTGNRRGKMVDLGDVCIEVASKETPRIQEAHLAIGHAICGLGEHRLFSAGQAGV